MTPQERIKAAKMWIETEPNAPKHFTKAGNEKCRDTIHALLEAAQGVDFEALGEALNDSKTIARTMSEEGACTRRHIYQAATALHNAMKGSE